MKKILLGVVAASLAAAGLVAVQSARAQTATTTAFIGGLHNDRTGEPELVVFNTTSSTLTLDLVLRGPDGVAIVTQAAALTVPPLATGTFDVQVALAHKGLKNRAYVGLVSAELTGEAPFGETTTIVHATQYFGSRKKPRGGFVVRPLFVASGT